MITRRTLALGLIGLALGGAGYKAQSGLSKAGADGMISFTLRDVQGAEVTAADYGGRWVLVFFGYTHCPDFCPTALAAAGGALGLLGSDAARVRAAFITLDPARDTPDVLGAYMESFGPGIDALTGTAEQVAAAAKAFKVFFVERPNPTGDGYGIDHTAAFWLLDPSGRPAEVYPYDIPAEVLASSLRKHIRGAAVQGGAL